MLLVSGVWGLFRLPNLNLVPSLGLTANFELLFGHNLINLVLLITKQIKATFGLSLLVIKYDRIAVYIKQVSVHFHFSVGLAFSDDFEVCGISREWLLHVELSIPMLRIIKLLQIVTYCTRRHIIIQRVSIGRQWILLLLNFVLDLCKFKTLLYPSTWHFVSTSLLDALNGFG